MLMINTALHATINLFSHGFTLFLLGLAIGVTLVACFTEVGEMEQ